jgi:hypothetical protein
MDRPTLIPAHCEPPGINASGGRHVARRAPAAVFLLLLGASLLLVYAPSLQHLPRADQWCFLLDTLEERGFAETFGKCWSYNRTRQVCAGDSALFRPVLFALLSAQKALFGHNSFLWQLSGIGLHLSACTLVFLVLKRAGRLAGNSPTPDPLPYALTTFFALNFAIEEQVIWVHIGGYLLFCALLLLALLLVPDPWNLTGTRMAAGRYGACLLCLAVALFTYEISQPFLLACGLGLGVLLWVSRRRAMAWVPLAVACGLVGLYQAVNQFDLRWHANQFEPDTDQQSIAGLALRWQTAVNFCKYGIYTLLAPWVPQCSETGFSGRLYVTFPRLTMNLVNVLGAMALGCCCLLAARGARRALAGRSWPHLAAAGAATAVICGHAAAVVLGRMNTRPDQPILPNNSYYAYVPLLFCVLALGALAAGAADPLRRNGARVWVPLRWTAAILMGVTTACSAGRVFQANNDVARQLAPERALYAQIERLLEQCGPSRRVAIDPAVSMKAPIIHGTPRTEILFRARLEHAQPDLVICERGGALALETAQETRARLCRPQGDLFPRLVAVGRLHNTYAWNGQLFAVLPSADPLQLDRKAPRSTLHASVAVRENACGPCATPSSESNQQ